MRCNPSPIRSARPRAALAAALVLALAATAAGCDDDSVDAHGPHDAHVHFASPADGARVAGSIELEMVSDGVTIEPAGDVHADAGHFHVMVDSDCVAAGTAIPKDGNHRHFGKGQTETPLRLPAGEHQLCLQVGDGAHAATGLTDEITVTVGVTTLDEWCGVAREIDEVLQEATPDGELDGELADIQPAHADVIALFDQLRHGIEFIDAERRDDLLQIIDYQVAMSEAVVDATDASAMRTEVNALAAVELDVDGSIFAWLESTCGFPGADDTADGASNEVPLFEPASHGDLAVIVDQSPTVSDVGALGFLAGRSDVQLLAVTMPGTGESACGPGARTTRVVLDAAGRADVPIGCGSDDPLDSANEWPVAWSEAADALAEVVAPGAGDAAFVEAEQLLADTIKASPSPVTIVALGPLTNIASVLRIDPSLADHIDRVVVMGGAVSVPGNVEPELDAEWNLFADPVAAREVITSGVAIDLVPLDATDSVPLTADYITAVGGAGGDAGSELADAVADVLGTMAGLDGMYMWDELTAVATVQPEVATWTEVMVAVGDDGSTVESPAGTAVRMAVDADAPSVRSIVLAALTEHGS